MAKQQKIYKVKTINFRNGSERISEGTLEELIEGSRYTLECGKAYEHEKGNKKINMNPKSIKAYITALNNARNNSAANGWSNYHSELVEE